MATKTGAEYRMLIGDEWVASGSGREMEIINPATEETIGTAPRADAADVDRAVAAARAAFEDDRWSGLAAGERSRLIWRVADLLEQNLERFAELESLNTGKPLKFTRDSDLPFAVDNIRFFATAARHLEGKAAAEYIPTHTSILRREPIGVVGSIAPWNYPIMMAVWKIFPAIAAGNTLVLKPSDNTPVTTLELGRLILEAGIPPGVVNIVTGTGPEVGVPISSHSGVDMVSYTGGTAIGRQVAAQAAPTVKKLHLELGGNAPFIVYDDADIEAAVNGAIAAGLPTCGQDCTAAARLYVQRPVYNKYLDRLTEVLRTVVVGDPFDPETDIGPLASAAQRDRIGGLVQRATDTGTGRLVLGGKQPSALPRGFFYEPTLVADVKQGSEICQTEVFGPVMRAIPFDTEEEAIKLANDTIYGHTNGQPTAFRYRLD